jgi:hypothetical protein
MTTGADGSGPGFDDADSSFCEEPFWARVRGKTLVNIAINRIAETDFLIRDFINILQIPFIRIGAIVDMEIYYVFPVFASKFFGCWACKRLL